MASRKQRSTPEVKTESVEAFEIPSQDTDFQTDIEELEFYPHEEVIQAGETTVIFREPTEEELPTREVIRADGGVIKSDFFTGDNEWAATVVGKSPNGATLQVTKRRDGVGYEISYRDGGKMPANMTGWYTTFDKAEVAARGYLATLWEEARKAG